MKPKRTFRYAVSLVLASLAFVLLPVMASASITQKFKTTDTLVIGSLVSLSPSAADTVNAATLSNLSALYGVVTQVDPGTVQVADTEVTAALVSTANGNVAVGDPITASPLAGIGQKATTSTRIVGYAQATFTAKTTGAITKNFKDTKGKTHQVAYGVIRVLLGVGSYQAPPSGASSPGNDQTVTGIPPAIQNFFDSLAGHQVVPNRIILSMFLLLVVVVIVGVIVSTSVRRSLTAIGRNPLASRSLLRGLAQIAFVAVVLIVGAMAGVYVIVTH